MTESVVRAHELSKSYRIFDSPWQRLVEGLTGRPRHRSFRALDGVSFELPAGESLGIVGENGAGKSTLLKLLAGVLTPTAGEVEVKGRISSILELGAGFHPEFTGRQNLRINAALLGLDAERVEAKTPEIVAFAELGDFIDRPVKSYSTGMVMRLAFAIATEVEPDVLIVDEALSVGDGYFQKKCMDRMVALTERGTTLLFCTHAMYYLTAFCHRALWLKGGRTEALGPARDVVAEYERHLLGRSSDRQRETRSQVAGEGAVDPGARELARLVRVEQSHGSSSLACGDPWTLAIEWQATSDELAFHLAVGLDRADGVQVASMSTLHDRLDPFRGQRHYRVVLEVPRLPFVQGEFSVYVFLLDEAGLHVYDRSLLREALEIRSSDYRIGLIDIAHQWQTAQRVPSTESEPVPGRFTPAPIERS